MAVPSALNSYLRRCGLLSDGEEFDFAHAAPFFAAWNDEQERRWDELAGNIGADGGGPISIFIHGFANSFEDAAHTYDTMDRLVPSRGHRVRLYWNGGTSIRSWKPAQGTGPLVGLQLRRLLNKLADRDRYDVRILTHSSGAFVAASLVGDAGGALPLAWDATQTPTPFEGACTHGNKCRALKNYSFYNAYAASTAPGSSLRVPDGRDLRIGMLAPATSAPSFEGSRIYRGTTSPGVVLVFGSNSRDAVTGKSILAAGSLGATTLGGDSWEEHLACVAETLQRRSSSNVVLGIDFILGRGVRGHWRHDAERYLANPAITAVVSLLYRPVRPGWGEVGTVDLGEVECALSSDVRPQ